MQISLPRSKSNRQEDVLVPGFWRCPCNDITGVPVLTRGANIVALQQRS